MESKNNISFRKEKEEVAMKIAWTGHVERMESNLPTRKVYSFKPEGDKGRPSARRVDPKDIKKL